jgi:hypothetical protein
MIAHQVRSLFLVKSLFSLENLGASLWNYFQGCQISYVETLKRGLLTRLIWPRVSIGKGVKGADGAIGEGASSGKGAKIGEGCQGEGAQGTQGAKEPGAQAEGSQGDEAQDEGESAQDKRSPASGSLLSPNAPRVPHPTNFQLQTWMGPSQTGRTTI